MPKGFLAIEAFEDAMGEWVPHACISMNLMGQNSGDKDLITMFGLHVCVLSQVIFLLLLN